MFYNSVIFLVDKTLCMNMEQLDKPYLIRSIPYSFIRIYNAFLPTK